MLGSSYYNPDTGEFRECTQEEQAEIDARMEAKEKYFEEHPEEWPDEDYWDGLDKL